MLLIKHKELSFRKHEFERVFILKQNKAINYYRLNSNVIANVYDYIKVILFNTFKVYLEEVASSEELTTIKAVSVF